MPSDWWIESAFGAQRASRCAIRSAFGPPDPACHTGTQNHAEIIWKRDLNSVVSRILKQRIFTVLVYFSWVTRLWLLLDNALEHSTKSNHFYPMGSASKMEVTFTQNSSFPPNFQKKWIISEGVHTNAIILTSFREIGTNDLNIFFGTDLRGRFPEQMPSKPEKSI